MSSRQWVWVRAISPCFSVVVVRTRSAAHGQEALQRLGHGRLTGYRGILSRMGYETGVAACCPAWAAVPAPHRPLGPDADSSSAIVARLAADGEMAPPVGFRVVVEDVVRDPGAVPGGVIGVVTQEVHRGVGVGDRSPCILHYATTERDVTALVDIVRRTGAALC